MTPEQRVIAKQALAEALASSEHVVRDLAVQEGITRQSIYQWGLCPPHRAIAVEALTGVPRQRLRPDLYPG